MNSNFINEKFSNFFDNLIFDLSFSDKNFLKIFFECSIILFAMLISAFFSWFVYVTLGMAIAFTLLNHNSLRNIYFFIILLPFNLFFVDVNHNYDLTQYVLFVVLITQIVNVLVKLKNKELTLNLKFSIIYSLLIIYVCQPWRIMFFISHIEIFMGLLLLYLVLIQIQQFDEKEIFFVIIFSILFSCFIGTLQEYSSHMQKLLPVFYTSNDFSVERFHGCGATNILACELVFCCFLTITLCFKNKIKVINYCILPILIFIMLKTYSKVALLCFLFLIVTTSLVCIIKIIHLQKVKNIIWITFFVFLIQNNDIIEICGRFNLENIYNSVENNLLMISSFSLLSSSFFYSFTTGRTEIWYNYIKDWLSNPLVTFFGHGAGLENLYWEGLAEEGISPHNMYLHFLNQYGIMLFVILLYMFFVLKKMKIYKIEKDGVLPILTMLICMLSEDFVAYEFIIMIVISFIFLLRSRGNQKIEDKYFKIYLKNKKVQIDQK